MKRTRVNSQFSGESDDHFRSTIRRVLVKQPGDGVAGELDLLRVAVQDVRKASNGTECDRCPTVPALSAFAVGGGGGPARAGERGRGAGSPLTGSMLPLGNTSAHATNVA